MLAIENLYEAHDQDHRDSDAEDHDLGVRGALPARVDEVSDLDQPLHWSRQDRGCCRRSRPSQGTRSDHSVTCRIAWSKPSLRRSISMRPVFNSSSESWTSLNF